MTSEGTLRHSQGPPYDTKDQLLKAKVLPRNIYNRIEQRSRRCRRFRSERFRLVAEN